MGRWEDGGWDDRSDGSDDGYAVSRLIGPLYSRIESPRGEVG